MAEFPFYSCDSTSWMRGQTFGVLIVNEGREKLNQYLRYDWPKAKERNPRIPDEVFVPLKGENKWYCPLLKWNAQEILNWTNEFKSEYSNLYEPSIPSLFDLL